MPVLRLKDENGNVFDVPALIGPQGERGDSGVYIGSGAMPDDCNLQIDPDSKPYDVERMVADAVQVATPAIVNEVLAALPVYNGEVEAV